MAVLCRTEFADDAMRERPLVSMTMTEFQNSKDQMVTPSHQKHSKHNYYKAEAILVWYKRDPSPTDSCGDGKETVSWCEMSD